MILDLTAWTSLCIFYINNSILDMPNIIMGRRRKNSSYEMTNR